MDSTRTRTLVLGQDLTETEGELRIRIWLADHDSILAVSAERPEE